MEFVICVIADYRPELTECQINHLIGSTILSNAWARFKISHTAENAIYCDAY